MPAERKQDARELIVVDRSCVDTVNGCAEDRASRFYGQHGVLRQMGRLTQSLRRRLLLGQ
jgi:hypothetical protein